MSTRAALDGMSVRAHDLDAVDQGHTHQDALFDIMEIIDNVKENMTDNAYVTVTRLLKTVYDNAPRRRTMEVGSYFTMSPDLQTYLDIDISFFMSYQSQVPRTFDMCLRFDGSYNELPRGHWLGQRAPYTRNERVNTSDLPYRDGEGPFYRFTPNINFMWILCDPRVDVLDMPTIWLEEWMLHLIHPIGPGEHFTRVVTYPNCQGFNHVTFHPLTATQEDPSLFDRFQEHDLKDKIAQDLLEELPWYHQWRWVGIHRGMKYGRRWKQVRDLVARRFILRWWWRVATRKRGVARHHTRRMRALAT